jgi:hypothetical protein
MRAARDAAAARRAALPERYWEPNREAAMARKPNYDFERRQREIAKKEAKAAKAAAKKAAAEARKAADDDPASGDEAGEPR